MPRYEYKVVPAPARGEKIRGIRATQDRFALTLTGMMNAMAEDGWEYQRAETLPCEERTGLMRTTTTYQNLLVFRRAVPEMQPAATAAPQMMAEPPSPAAMAASLTPNPPMGGAAPRLSPARKAGDATNVTPIGAARSDD